MYWPRPVLARSLSEYCLFERDASDLPSQCASRTPPLHPLPPGGILRHRRGQPQPVQEAIAREEDVDQGVTGFALF